MKPVVYRALAEYLLHRRAVQPYRGWMLLIPVSTCMIGAFLKVPGLIPLFFLSGIVIMILVCWGVLVRNRNRQLASGDVELETWLDTLARFAREGQLEQRSHPALIADLEGCALIRQQILGSLNSSEWRRLTQRPAWSEVRRLCEESADSLFLDALWASRGAFRPLGGRRETFKRRCEDADFAAVALGGVRLARASLAQLLDEVSGDPFVSRGGLDSLERARVELAALRDAEEELRQTI